MKVEITLILDLPKSAEEVSDKDLRQVISDEYINYIKYNRIKDSHSCYCKPAKTEEEKELQNLQYNKHVMWSHICESVKWSFKKLKDE